MRRSVVTHHHRRIKKIYHSMTGVIWLDRSLVRGPSFQISRARPSSGGCAIRHGSSISPCTQGHRRSQTKGPASCGASSSQKAIRNHAELTGYVYLWEGTHAFTTRRLLLSSIRDRGCTHGPRHETGHAVPESNPKSRVGRRRAVARRADNQARAMAAIAVGERGRMGSAPTSEARPEWRTVRAAFPHMVPTLVSTATMCCRMRASICDTLMRR